MAYSERLLAAYQAPQYREECEGITVRNPLCGDEITACVAARRVSWTGRGCAISLGTAELLARAVDAGEPLPASEEELWTFIDLTPPAGRVRCATMALQAMLEARAIPSRREGPTA